MPMTQCGCEERSVRVSSSLSLATGCILELYVKYFSLSMGKLTMPSADRAELML